MVLKQDGSVWVTGENKFGQLGIGSTASKSTFTKVTFSSKVTAIATRFQHSMVVQEDGSVWATGSNQYGQLGLSHSSGLSKPGELSTKVVSFVEVVSSGARAVAAGSEHSMMLKQDGSVWATGRNNDGQLGDGSKIDSNIFVKVFPSGVQAVIAAEYHSMLLKRDGSVWVTGFNEHGQLGDGSTDAMTRFTRVAQTGESALFCLHYELPPCVALISTKAYA